MCERKETMNTTDKGTILELYVLARLFEKGYQMATPFGTQSGWDLLCWKDNKFQRLQIKTARMRGIKKDRVYVDFLRSKDRIQNTKTGKWSYKGYSKDEIDYVIAVLNWTALKGTKQFPMWIIPVKDIENKRSITFGVGDYVFDW